MKKVCILLVLITYVYHNARLKKRKVCIVTRLEAGQMRNHCLIPGSSKRWFAFSKMARSILGVKWLGY
jgi:hypothetical protein